MKLSLCRMSEGQFEIGMAVNWEDYGRYIAFYFWKRGIFIDFPVKEME